MIDNKTRLAELRTAIDHQARLPADARAIEESAICKRFGITRATLRTLVDEWAWGLRFIKLLGTPEYSIEMLRPERKRILKRVIDFNRRMNDGDGHY